MPHSAIKTSTKGYYFAVDAASAAGLRSSRTVTVMATPMGDDTSGTLAGTVTAPSGGDLSGTNVPAGDGCDQQRSKSVDITQSGPSASFSFEGLGAASYTIAAFKDNNGNGQPDDGDFYGESPPVAPPVDGVAVTMELIDNGGTDTTEGTLTAPPDGDVSGTQVIACPVTEDDFDCDAPETQFTTVSTAGPSASYSIGSLASGPYVVIVLKDVDGNNDFNDGDYFGGYPSADALKVVTPPAQGIDITLEVYADDGNGGEDDGSGGDQASLGGTLTAPPGRSFTGTLYLNICYQNDCDDERSVFWTFENASGSSQGYGGNLAPRSYTVTAIDDVNGNGELDEGDYLGIYGGNFDTPQQVTAPATEVDVALQVVTGEESVVPLRLGGLDTRFHSLFNR